MTIQKHYHKQLLALKNEMSEVHPKQMKLCLNNIFPSSDHSRKKRGVGCLTKKGTIIAEKNIISAEKNINLVCIQQHAFKKKFKRMLFEDFKQDTI